MPEKIYNQLEGERGKMEGLEEIVPAEDLNDAVKLVDEGNKALEDVKREREKRFIDQETQLPRVGGNFGNELRAAILARREADQYTNSEKHYEITIPKWHQCEEHLDNIGRMIADALQKGKSGYDFRTALPYKIGHIGGVEMVF